METLLVRLKPYDPRRGNVLRRYTYAGIKFQEERAWYRVERAVADHLRDVRQVPDDEHTPLAFDVCTDAEAKALEAKESDAAKFKRSATDDLAVVPARSVGVAESLNTADLPKSTSTQVGKDDDKDARRGKREKD